MNNSLDDIPLIKGWASKVTPLVADLLRADSRTLPPALQSTGNYEPKTKPVPLSRYYSHEIAELERERLWKKTWQFACREEDIPNVGDRVPYNVGTLSFIILRSAPNEFKAFYNSCLHRGTRLCEGKGGGEHIRCPFHGWSWNLDGSLHKIPSDWDFPHVTRCKEEFALPEVKVGTWGGFIFINPDPEAPPLEPVLGVLPEHFRSWEPENHFTCLHISHRVNANWKITLEAFLESYHVVETHTDALPFSGDAATQYDVWDDGASHISRLLTPLGVPSPHLGDEASAMEALEGVALLMAQSAGPGVEPPRVDSPETGRAQIAEWRRKTMGTAMGRDFSHLTDAEMLDSIQYYMFPNFCPWYGEGLPLVYQFLPDGDDPERSIMNIRVLAPLPGGGGPRPPSAPIIDHAADEDFASKFPGMGILADVFDQDMGNLPLLQQGTKALEKQELAKEVGKISRIQQGLKGQSNSHGFATFGRYQEIRIIHFHEVLGKVLGLAEGQ